MVEPLSNVKEWHNYWTGCDWISGSIPAVENIGVNSSGDDLQTCHSSYYKDLLIWEGILTDVLNTSLPLEISYAPSQPSSPTDVAFIATGSLTSDLSASYSWDFGDGQSESGQSVSHYYGSPSTYNVTLTMLDGSGGTHVLTKALLVAPPQIDITKNGGCDSFHVDVSTPDNSRVQSHLWDFGDGNPQKTGRTNDHTYASEGVYTVTLYLTLDGGEQISSSKSVSVGTTTQYLPNYHVYGNETIGGCGTYVVQGGITIHGGAHLTIEPGTRMEFASGGQIAASGTLTATGVTFTWADGQSQWGGIIFDADSSGSQLRDCTIEHVNGSLWGNDFGSVWILGTSPTITGCTFSNSNSNYAIRIFHGSPVLSNNTISGFVASGIIVDSSPWIGGSTVTSAPTVSGNMFLGNGIGINIDSFSSGTYQGNTISGNGNYGILVSYASNNPVFSNNTYSNNTTADVFVSGTINGTVSWNEPGMVIYRTSGLNIARSARLSIASGRRIE